MKISQFCKKFNIPITTMRYYILVGLLIPNKKNNQFIFTDSDAHEMDMILQLKELDFSTQEIKQFLQVIRLYHMSDATMNAQLLALYESKKNQLELTVTKYLSSIHALERKIIGCARESEPCQLTGGIPVAFSGYLACPHCGEAFHFSQVQIHNNQIRQGNMDCSCGYHALIEDGIILANPSALHLGDNLEKPQNYYTSPAFHVMHYKQILQPNADFVFFEYMSSISNEVTALIHKAYIWIHSILEQQKTPGRIIFAPDLSSHFLYKFVDSPYLRDAYIVISGFSKQTINSIKSHIDRLAPSLQIIYIANTICELPIRKKSIDLWIDANSSYNFSFFHDFALQGAIEEYMCDTAQVVGYSKYHDHHAKSLKNIRRLYPYAAANNSLLATFHQNMQKAGWRLLLEESLGYAVELGTYYEYQEKGERHHFHGFHAEKTKKAQTLAEI